MNEPKDYGKLLYDALMQHDLDSCSGDYKKTYGDEDHPEGLTWIEEHLDLERAAETFMRSIGIVLATDLHGTTTITTGTATVSGVKP